MEAVQEGGARTALRWREKGRPEACQTSITNVPESVSMLVSEVACQSLGIKIYCQIGGEDGYMRESKKER